MPFRVALGKGTNPSLTISSYAGSASGPAARYPAPKKTGNEDKRTRRPTDKRLKPKLRPGGGPADPCHTGRDQRFYFPAAGLRHALARSWPSHRDRKHRSARLQQTGPRGLFQYRTAALRGCAKTQVAVCGGLPSAASTVRGCRPTILSRPGLAPSLRRSTLSAALCG